MRIVSTLTLALLVATAGLLGACGTETLSPATACVIDNDCERGQACVDGLCTASSAVSDTSGSGDATETDTARRPHPHPRTHDSEHMAEPQQCRGLPHGDRHAGSVCCCQLHTSDQGAEQDGPRG